MKNAVQTKNKSIFRGRELRVRKAVEPKRLEKKANKKREKKLLEKGSLQQRIEEATDSEHSDVDEDVGKFMKNAQKSLKEGDS